MIFKVVRNRKTKNPVKVSRRVDYIHKKAVWENSDKDIFISSVKDCFKDEKTTHLIISFDEVASVSLRKVVQHFVETKFKDHNIYIGEHIEQRKEGQMSAFHIILSRNIESGKLLHLSNKEFYRLRKEWFNYVKPYLNDEQLNKVGKWEENLEKRKLNKEQRFYLEPWQVREFEELEQEMERRGYISFDKAKDVRSFKASAKFLGVKVLEYLKGNKVDALVKFLRLFNAEIKSKETKSGRVRHYLNLPYKDKRKEGIRFVDVRIDNLTPELREVLDGVYRIYRENRNIEERAGAVKKGNTATKEQENPIDKGNTTIRGQEKPINKGYQGIGTEERVNSRRQESSKCSMEFREQQSQRTSAQRITKNSKNLRSSNFFDNTNHGDKKNRKNKVKNNFDLNNYFIVIWNPQKKEKIHLEIGKVIDVDFGVKISMINENSALIQGGTAQTQAVIAIKLAKKLKWKGISTNSDDKEFIKHLVSYAKKNNIKFVPKNDFQKEILMANELADNSGNVFGPTL